VTDVFTTLVCAHAYPKEPQMLDLVFLAVGFGFFALSIAYAIACDRL
jgi:hypothetical protein